MTIEEKLNILSKSKFRSRFHLSQKDKEYIRLKGYDEISKHAYDFINKRLAPSYIENDGKQTPMKGHPVFIAQHACACCCRGCLQRWYNISKNRKLNAKETKLIVNILMAWLQKEMQI